ncbi:PHP domain-containing protein [Candidatus Sumerlaeota bacterium]|nr:PHP domain-containing protein [Candidatus Sumerlaeota bacterium]
MSERLVDLHMHSTASDGSLTPSELVAHALEVGLAAIALTDHDTTDGVAEAIAAGERLGLEVVPGIEISAKRERGTLHIVGLFIDPANRRLQERCVRLRAERAARNGRMAERLTELGMPVSIEEVRAKSGGGVLGRPHFAAVMLEKGHVTSLDEAFDRWIAKGRPAYFPKALFDPAESIEMIHDAGGVAILAHPSQLLCDTAAELEGMVTELRDLGLDGIETQWSTATAEEMEEAERLAERHGLLRSGGSDFHGGVKPDIRIGVARGQIRLTGEVLEALREAAQARR